MRIDIYIILKTPKVERKEFHYAMRKKSDVGPVKEKIKNLVKKYLPIKDQFISMYARIFYDRETENGMIGELKTIEDVDKAMEQLKPYIYLLKP